MSGNTQLNQLNNNIDSREKLSKREKVGNSISKNLWEIFESWLDENVKKTLDDIVEKNIKIEWNIENDWTKWCNVYIDLWEKWKFKMFIPENTYMIKGIDNSNKNYDILLEYFNEKWIDIKSQFEFTIYLTYLLTKAGVLGSPFKNEQETLKFLEMSDDKIFKYFENWNDNEANLLLITPNK